MLVPFEYPEEMRLLCLSSLNWDAKACLMLDDETDPSYTRVGRYSEGRQALFGLASARGPFNYWSTQHDAYIYDIAWWTEEPMAVRYTRRRAVGVRVVPDVLFYTGPVFTTGHDMSRETVGGKLCLHRLGRKHYPFQERLELEDYQLDILKHLYPKATIQRGPKNYDFFDIDYFGGDDETQPVAVGLESRSINIDEPDLPGQPDEDLEFESDPEDNTDAESDEDDDDWPCDEMPTEEDLGWTGPWVDKLVAAKERGGPMPTRREVKWYYSGSEKLWGAEMVLTPISFELYKPEKKHPHKCLEAYTVVATVKRVFVTKKWFELEAEVTVPAA